MEKYTHGRINMNIKLTFFFLLLTTLQFCSTNPEVDTRTWSQRMEIVDGTGILYSSVEVRAPWNEVDTYLYLKESLISDSYTTVNYLVKIDTVENSHIVMKNIPPGEYELIANDQVSWEGNILGYTPHFYSSFSSSCKTYTISIRPDSISMFLNNLIAPGQLFALMDDNVNWEYSDTCHFDEPDNLNYLPINEENLELIFEENDQ